VLEAEVSSAVEDWLEDELCSTMLLEAIELSVGLFIALVVLPPSPDAAPPQAVRVAASHIKDRMDNNLLAHLHIYLHLRCLN
jgi:hypothetical protein